MASTTLMAPMSREFVKKIHTFANDNQIKMVRFEKGQRKDNITRQRLQRFEPKDGVVYIGVAQEKFLTFRVEKKRNATGEAFTWLSRSKVMCNQYYLYLLDRDFGTLFFQILQLLSVYGAYLPERPRICQKPVGPTGLRL